MSPTEILLYFFLLVASCQLFVAACGRIQDDGAVANRVIGGHIAAEGNWPWVVYISAQGSTWHNGSGCTANIISERHLLTAAHCFYGGQLSEEQIQIPAESFTAYIGCLDYYTCPRTMKAAKVHFPFNSSGRLSTRWVGDVAVLELAERLNFSASIQPVCLALEFRERVGEYAFFAGYGKHDAPNGTFLRSVHTRENIVQFRPSVDCKSRNFTRHYNPPHAENFMCAGGRKRNAFKGDSGGALVINSKGVFYEVGVFSLSVFATSLILNEFQRVAPYCDWIANVTGGAALCREIP